MPRGHRYEQERPLPREWLPEPTPLEGTPEWEVARARVLAKLAAPSGAQAPSWPAVLGSWWKPAAVLAAAAAALLLVTDPSPRTRPADMAEPGALPLRLLAAGGHPAALMEELGIPADPVLALVASRGDAR